MNRGGLRPPIAYADLDQDILRSVLGVLHEYVKVAIPLEDAGVQQLILHVAPVAAPIGLDQVAVREGLLRILVQVLHVGVSGGAIQIKVIFFDVFPMIALTVCEAEHPFLQNGILAVPHSQSEAQQLFVIADTGQAVFTPVIGSRSRLVVTKVAPGISILAVVLANRAPLALAKVRAPLLPGNVGYAS